ncbi:MAG: hypothetical protein F4020_09115 [Gammaproteobacteria bacterium]|nr:hypothetical protein [Gammaproteobacteria bacterium]MYK69656.1 hypothetical protein [Gammaproteobacteria bacterium]
MILALLTGASASGAEGQDTRGRGRLSEGDVTRMLSSSNWRDRDEALRRLPRTSARCAGSALRTALIEAAWAEVRNQAPREGFVDDQHEPGAYIMHYLWAAYDTRDPRTISLMLETGHVSPDALADMGLEALPPVLRAAADLDRDSYTEGADGFVHALLFMLVDGTPGPTEREAIASVLRKRLDGRQSYVALTVTMEAALVHGDPGLRRAVERIAADSSSAAQRLDEELLVPGDLDMVAFTQAYASELLAGEGGIARWRKSDPGCTVGGGEG